MSSRIVLLAFMLAPAVTSAAIAAQEVEPRPKPVRASAGLGLVIAQPVGEFDDFIDPGFGLGGHFLLHVDRRGVLGLRADAGFVVYGHERSRVCLSQTVGCRIEVDLTTTNDIAYVSLGPQLTVPAGPVQPYINASLGYSYFSTTSSLDGVGRGDDEGVFRTTNFDDGTFSWQAGTGLRVPLHVGRTPFFIDLGARYNTNGRVEYLREGDIVDHGDGSITLNPQRSDANLVTWVIGGSVAIRW